MKPSAAVLAAKLIDAPRRVNDFLLARVERVASRADFDVDIPADGGSRGKLVSAAAHDLDVLVGGMDSFFHSGTTNMTEAAQVN